jgi:peroxiredoxin Q/BCP
LRLRNESRHLRREVHGGQARLHPHAAWTTLGGWRTIAHIPASFSVSGLSLDPDDFTPVCTRQFCSYRDGADRLDQLRANVLGISPQSADSHDRFVAKYGLTIPLLADPDRHVVKAYGVLGPGGLVRRSVFIVDPEGVVRYRHVALLGLHYKDVAELGTALERARRDTSAPS